MNPFAILLFLTCSAAILSVKREWVLVPLLVGCTYMTLGQGIELGPISLPVYRMLLLVGLVRVIVKGEKIAGSMNTIDRLMIGWSVWVVFASLFHDPERAGPVFASGVVFNQTMIYFLIRTWIHDLDELAHVIKILALLLVPVAGEMMFEKLTGKNLFGIFGGVPDYTVIREGKLRAQGPFRHPILAGTVGATCIPLFIAIIRRHRTHALIGIAAGVFIVLASASSGPVMSLMAGAGAIFLWRFRHLTKVFLASSAAIYLMLMAVMEKPPYYLIARIDISGGSTGWHRAFLIDQTTKHLSEWWLWGTDFTRHWMPSQGMGADPRHTDITNYYIGFGVSGGLLSLGLVIAMLVLAFKWVGRVRLAYEEIQSPNAFMIWCYGASLFSHVVTGFSVAYFDQSMVYFWHTVAVVGSVYSVVILDGSIADSRQPVPVDGDLYDAEPAMQTLSNEEWRSRFRNRPPGRSLEEVLADTSAASDFSPPNRHI